MQYSFINGRNIYLRGLAPDDLKGGWKNWFNNPDVCEFNNHHRFPENSDKHISYLASLYASSDMLVLAICLHENDAHIGNISLQCIDWINRNAEFAIIMGEKKYWGKGYGKEAGLLIIEHGFQQLNLARIYCGTHQDNKGMRQLAMNIGMKEEGCRRGAIFKNGKYSDIIEYGILKSRLSD